MLYDWQYKHERTTHKLLFQTKFEEFFHASYSSRHINKNILTHRFHHVEASSVHHLVFVGAFFLSAITLLPISLPSAKPTLPRRIAVDLSNREERSTHSLERLQSLWTKDNARYKIPLCRLSTLCFLFFESLIVPSPHLIQSLSLILLCFARLRTSLDSSRPSYAACDWLTDRTASARSPRTNFEFERTERSRI